MTVTIDDVRAAAARIAGRVRRTPLLPARPARETIVDGAELSLKLECLQVIGSFKARGAMSKLTALDDDAVQRGLITASGGNHGLGVAYAGWSAHAPARIYLPHSTPRAKAEKLEAWGADVIMHGAVWDEANEEAMRVAKQDGLTYVHPFADPAIIAGQGTVALEVLEDLADVDVVVVAIGGGGLIAGTSLVIKALKPGATVIGVEPTGAPTLYESLKAGRLVELPNIATEAGTLAPRMSAQINLDLISAHVDDIVLIDDDDMRAAARCLWREYGVAAEMSGAAAVAALMVGAYKPPAGAKVCAIVCGTGTDGLPTG